MPPNKLLWSNSKVSFYFCVRNVNSDNRREKHSADMGKKNSMENTLTRSEE